MTDAELELHDKNLLSQCKVSEERGYLLFIKDLVKDTKRSGFKMPKTPEELRFWIGSFRD